MRTEIRLIQSGITLLAVSGIVTRILFPDIKIDAITLSLLILALLPWIAPLIKTLKLPGGTEIEFQDLQKTTKEAEKLGLLAEMQEDENPYVFEFIPTDPNLALAKLRIDIEKRLRDLAVKAQIRVNRRFGIKQLLSELTRESVLSKDEASLLSDYAETLNRAVHGASIDSRTAELALHVGERLLRGLESKL